MTSRVGVLALLVSLGALALGLGAILDTLCYHPGPHAARDTDWESRGVQVVDATAAEVYNHLIADLERRGYEICYELKRVTPDSRGELCRGECGPVTSFRKGIIVAEGYAAGTERPIPGGKTAWDGITQIWTFREQRGETSIALNVIGSFLPPPKTPRKFVSEPTNIAARFWSDLPGEIAREISSAGSETE